MVQAGPTHRVWGLPFVPLETVVYHPLNMASPLDQPLKTLTRENLRQGVIAGARRVIAHRDLLNRINVFPVPDGDTGTNVAATMRAIIDGLHQPLPTLDAVGTTIALSALTGAQGNSGVILAQFFQGLREGIADSVHLSVERFVDAIRHASGRAREALAEPKEGTILTVISDVAEHLNEGLHRLPDFRSLLDEGLQVARTSLAETTQRLAALREAGVVDAGALAFVHFLEGIRDHLFHGSSDVDIVDEEPPMASTAQANLLTSAVQPVDFRYCTEAVVLDPQVDRKAILEQLKAYGDSVVVAGSAEEIHAHVHTNAPALVLEVLEDAGRLASKKIDDMWEALVPAQPDAERSGLALVTDSVCDLPLAFLTEKRIQVVPLRAAFGEDVLLDRVDLTPRQFYRRLESDPVHPTTSQPRPIDFLTLYRHLASRFASILSIHISGDASGTVSFAQTAARQVVGETGISIDVVDSRSASSAEGLIVWAASRAKDAGLSLARTARLARAAVKNAKVFVYVPTLKYFIRGGRLSPLQGRIAGLLHLLPIITVDDGKMVSGGKALGKRNAIHKVLRSAIRAAGGFDRPIFAISHTDAPDLAKRLATELQRRFADAEILLAQAAPALGSHAGPGGAAIAVLDAALVDREVASE